MNVLIKNAKLKIGGMKGRACVAKIKNSFQNTDGLFYFDINLFKNTATIQYDDSLLSLDDILNKINETGYTAVESVLPILSELDISKQTKILIFTFILSIPLFISLVSKITYINIPLINNGFFQLALATPIQFIIGYRFFKSAVYKAFSRKIGIDLLVSISTVSGYFLSVYSLYFAKDSSYLFFDSIALIINLILFGQLLQAKERFKSQEQIHTLQSLQPQTSIIIEGGIEKEVSIDSIKRGDIVYIKPEEKIPADGVLTEGSGLVDEQFLTGNKSPVEKTKGSTIISGSTNISGTFKYRALKVHKDTFISKVLDIITNSASITNKKKDLDEKLLAIFIPAVIAVSLISFASIYFVTHSFYSSFRTAISILLISSPCSLLFIHPIAFFISIGISFKKDILIKNINSVESLQKINTFIFEKTGTITIGKPELTDILTVGSLTKSEAIKIAAIAEKESEHLLGIALYEHGKNLLGELPFPEKYENFPGMGIKAVVGNKSVIIGTPKFIEKSGGLLYSCDKQITYLEAEGKTPIILSVSDSIEAVFGFKDTIRDDSENVVMVLKSAGYEVFMITGDTNKSAQMIGKQAGIDNIIAEVLPQDKPYWIKQLQSEGKKVAMIGDGITDSLSLAASDIGIAIGSENSSVIEIGDIIFKSGNLSSLITTLRLSRRVNEIVNQNIFWTIFYSILGTILVLLNISNPLIICTFILFSSFTILLNSFFLKSF